MLDMQLYIEGFIIASPNAARYAVQQTKKKDMNGLTYLENSMTHQTIKECANPAIVDMIR